jgi:hypothetical protein
MEEKFSWATVVPWVVVGGIGMLGRLMYHASQVQSGKRKPFSWILFWDVPIALGMGWIALGLGTYLQVSWEVTVSLALIISYLGPYTIDTVFAAWSKNKNTLKEPNNG